MSRLDHPRIVKVLEYGIHDETPFIAMERILTISLAHLIDQQPVEQRLKTACWVVSRVLQPLHYAHENGVVHRDVKPSNIMAYRDAHRLHVKLGDFGLAKFYESAGFSGMTDEHSVRGTFRYMAPEQIRDSRNVKPAADIYGTGACLFRFVTGNKPPADMVSEKSQRAALLTADVPDGIAAIVTTAMASKPEDRFPSALAMELALQQVLSGFSRKTD